jgi:hypothetical protein
MAIIENFNYCKMIQEKIMLLKHLLGMIKDGKEVEIL